jgi:hypothetical protein
MTSPQTFAYLTGRIQRETVGHALLEQIREFNHAMIGELNKIYPVAGSKLLDVGASPRGYDGRIAYAGTITSVAKNLIWQTCDNQVPHY